MRAVGSQAQYHVTRLDVTARDDLALFHHAYGKPGDYYRFYEINPQVIDVAMTEFTYLTETPAKVENLLGDARLTMEREPAQNYDVLAIDAFSSDSIPTHLMTHQAMGIYLKNMKADGVIVGAVQRTETGIRVEVRLIQVRTGDIAMAQLYTGDASARA